MGTGKLFVAVLLQSKPAELHTGAQHNPPNSKQELSTIRRTFQSEPLDHFEGWAIALNLEQTVRGNETSGSASIDTTSRPPCKPGSLKTKGFRAIKASIKSDQAKNPPAKMNSKCRKFGS